MIDDVKFLTPVLGLVVWTLVIWCLLLIRRIPAMKKAGIEPNDTRKIGALDNLPSPVKWAGDNYNHLHEQPVLFYALMFFLFLSGLGDGLAYILGWAYVGSRILHSLVQVTLNEVMLRFILFLLGSAVLIIMVGRAVAALI